MAVLSGSKFSSDTVSDLYSIPVGLCDHSSESEMEPNGSFDPNLAGLDSHLFDDFLVNLNSDTYPLIFSDSGNAPIAEEQSDDYNCLECIGPPTDYDTHSAPSDSALGNEFLQATVGSTGEHPIVRHLRYVYMNLIKFRSSIQLV
jgi:hypothetical protein